MTQGWPLTTVTLPAYLLSATGSPYWRAENSYADLGTASAIEPVAARVAAWVAAWVHAGTYSPATACKPTAYVRMMLPLPTPCALIDLAHTGWDHQARAQQHSCGPNELAPPNVGHSSCNADAATTLRALVRRSARTLPEVHGEKMLL